jgi:hypothetical protein
MTFIDETRKWFSREWGGSLILPDGWFGRPYGAQHSLTDVRLTSDGFELLLDDNLVLRFAGLKSVRATGRELTFGPFASLQFTWTPFGGGSPSLQEYGPGEVKIVAAPG